MDSFLGLKYLELISEFMIKSSLILCCSLLLLFLLRKKSASMRHFLLSFTLISLLFLPLFSTFMTGWETRFLPSWKITEESSLDFTEAKKIEGSLGHLDRGDISTLENSTILTSLEKNERLDKATAFRPADVTTIFGLSLITIWTAGLLFLLTRITAGLYGAHRLTRQGKRVSGPFWQLLLERFLNAVFIRRKISLLSHDKVRVPLTWGVFKPVVIIPAEAENWNRDECSSALFHELSHVKRSDFLFKVLAHLSCALYWFNPLSWLVFRLMRKEQEKACDELVLKAGVKPSTYAANLLSIQKAGQFQWNPPAAVLGAVGKSQLNERLLAILKQQFKPKEVKMKTKILLSLFVIAAITFVGLARPAQSKASSTAIFSDSDEIMTEIQNTTQAENTQEKQEKKKTKKEEKKESTEEKAYVPIKVIKDDKEKKIVLEGKPYVVIKKDKSNKVVILRISEKDIELIKDGKCHWTIKADKLQLIGEDLDKVIELGEDTEFSIIVDKGKDSKKIQIIKAPEIKLTKALDIPLSSTVKVKGGKKTLHISPLGELCIIPPLGLVSLAHKEKGHKKLREKLEKLREKLKEFKESQVEKEKEEAVEEALKTVEEVLEEMKKELEKTSKELDDIHVDIKPDIKLNLAKDFKHGIKLNLAKDLKHGIKLNLAKNIKLAEKIKDLKGLKKGTIYIPPDCAEKITYFVDKDGGIQIVITSKLDSENKAKYEEILKELKECLPECYEVESKINEKDNTIIIKIICKKKDEKPMTDVKKLAEQIVDELIKVEKKFSN